MRPAFKMLLAILALNLLILCGCADKTADDSYSLQTVDFAPQNENSELTQPLDYTVVSFVGAGDNITYYGNVREALAVSASSDSTYKYDFRHTYEEVSDIISEADIAFINQETLMCGEGFDISYYPLFNSPQDMGYQLDEIGFDVVNIATNHMLDKGAKGLSQTIDFLKDLDMLMIGGYENEEDYNTLRIYEEQGVKIAFLSYTYFTNYITLSADSDLCVPYLDKETVASQVARADAEADLVIVSAHWGDENTFKPNYIQKEYAQIMADNGADVILGHHPHVLQPIEWITAKDGRQTLCVYSLGNFVAEMAKDYNMVGGLITFDIVRYGDAEPSIENVLFIPTVYDFTPSFYDNSVLLLSDYSEEQAKAHGIKYYGNYTSLSKLKGYVTSTISSEFLGDFE